MQQTLVIALAISTGVPANATSKTPARVSSLATVFNARLKHVVSGRQLQSERTWRPFMAGVALGSALSALFGEPSPMHLADGAVILGMGATVFAPRFSKGGWNNGSVDQTFRSLRGKLSRAVTRAGVGFDTGLTPIVMGLNNGFRGLVNVVGGKKRLEYVSLMDSMEWMGLIPPTEKSPDAR